MSLYIEMEFSGQRLSSGTAFVVERSGRAYLVTNRHNVRGRRSDNDQPLHTMGGVPDAVRILHNAAGQLGVWIPKVERLYDRDGCPLWLEHPHWGGQVDAVALPLTDVSGADLYPYDPWTPGPPILCGPSDAVSIVGFPFGYTAGGAFAIWVQGAIASELGIDLDGLPRFMIDSRTRPGSSGSPVIAYRAGGSVPVEGGRAAFFAGPVWRLLGIYSGRLSPEADLGHVWKAHVIAEIIDGQTRGA